MCPILIWTSAHDCARGLILITKLLQALEIREAHQAKLAKSIRRGKQAVPGQVYFRGNCARGKSTRNRVSILFCRVDAVAPAGALSGDRFPQITKKLAAVKL